MKFPGRIIRFGEPAGSIFNNVKNRLLLKGYVDARNSDHYDLKFEGVVSLFQSQSFGPQGQVLEIDGEVGPLTWEALFGNSVSPQEALGPLSAQALNIAHSQLGVAEDPKGSNRGEMIDQYLISAGSSPGQYWCMAFVYWCFMQSAHSLNGLNPFPKTAGCVKAWGMTPKAHKILKISAQKSPMLVKPGMVFIHDYGGGTGHTGFVVANHNGYLETIEGNTDPMGGDNGLAVLHIKKRTIMDKILVGFISF